MDNRMLLKKLAFPISLILAACGGGGGAGGSSVPAGTGGGGNPNAIASIVLALNGTLVAGRPANFTLSVTAKNSSGAVLTGAYVTPISLSDSDTSGATFVSPNSVPNSSTQVTVSYNGSPAFKGATITASAPGVAAQLNIPVASACSRVGGIQGYIPCDLQSAYSLPTSSGVGQTIALVLWFDDPNAESDLAVYRSTFGLPPCTTANGCFRKVNESGQQGNYPMADASSAQEESLDLDMASAVCPNCHLILVEGNTPTFTDVGVSENTAVSLGATEISNSYGNTEFAGENTCCDAYYNHPGVAITVSSGDGGFVSGTQYPAASPFVTAVGGSSLVMSNNNRGWDETVWPGSGSGCSAFEPKPTWQTDGGCPKRMVSDVSAVADPATGVAVYDTYFNTGWRVFGGTSASSPILAGVYALAGNAASVNYGSFPYLHPGSLNDVVTGSNGVCSPAYFCTAQVGYDGPTGLGTPNGVTGLLRALGFSSGVRHHASLPGPGARSRRVCSKPRPGEYACDAIIVDQ